MPEIKTFKDLDKLCKVARTTFSRQLTNKQTEIDLVFSTCFDLLKSIAKFKSPTEWKDSREEYTLSVMIQALETLTAMYYLSESGFWDNALVLKRNFSELLSIAIAIGYDKQCFLDWKNGRDCFNSFSKIAKRVENSGNVPDVEKSLLPHLKRYWNESSQLFSHNISNKAIRTCIKDGYVKYEPKIATAEFQEQRLNTLRNMGINVVSIIAGIFSYDAVVISRKLEFPEAPSILQRCNEIFQNKEWQKEKTK